MQTGNKVSTVLWAVKVHKRNVETTGNRPAESELGKKNHALQAAASFACDVIINPYTNQAGEAAAHCSAGERGRTELLTGKKQHKRERKRTRRH